MHALWLASLLTLLWCLRHLAPGEAHLALRRFSPAAAGVVGALVVAGSCLAWLQLGGGLEPLWDTAYGLRLAGKLALVAGLLALAAVNRFLFTPRIARDDPAARRHLDRTLAADVALGLGVLAVTASFPFGPPPRAVAMAERGTAAEGVTIVGTGRGGKAMLTLVPGRPGANRLEVWVTDMSGAPIAAKEATVSATLPEAGIEPVCFRAATLRRGAYVAEGLAVPRAGRWRLRLDLLGAALVLPLHHRAPMTAAGFRKQLARIGAAAGFPFPYHPHISRHACGYKLAHDGHDTRAIQEWLGHRNIRHTTRYTELTTRRLGGLLAARGLRRAASAPLQRGAAHAGRGGAFVAGNRVAVRGQHEDVRRA